MKQATQEEYVADPGKCPCCRKNNIAGEFIEVEKNRAYQGIKCYDCGAFWYDEYKLTGYSNLERGSV